MIPKANLQPSLQVVVAVLLFILATSAGCTLPAFELSARPSTSVRSPSTLDAAGTIFAEPPTVAESSSSDPSHTSLAALVHREASQQPTARERLLIYTAQLTVESANPEATLAKCRDDASSVDGYLSTRNGTAMTFRIPAAHFEDFLSKVRALGRVLDESMQVTDATRQRRDTAIRLDNAKRARERLIKLLESADKVDDVLAIEREITRLTEVIEQAEAALRSLDDRIAYSTVTVSVSASNESVSSVGTLRGSVSSFEWIRRVGIDKVIECF